MIWMISLGRSRIRKDNSEGGYECNEDMLRLKSQR